MNIFLISYCMPTVRTQQKSYQVILKILKKDAPNWLFDVNSKSNRQEALHDKVKEIQLQAKSANTRQAKGSRKH